MPPNKVQYRNYKKFEVHSFLQDVEQLPEKISYTEGKKILWNAKQTRSSQNEGDSRKS